MKGPTVTSQQHGSETGYAPAVSNGKRSPKKTEPPEERGSLQYIFNELLNEIYATEKQLISFLPVMAQGSYNIDLANVVETRWTVAGNQVTRLEKIIYMLGTKNQARECKAMEKLVSEAGEVLHFHHYGPVRDALLLISLQKIVRYKMSVYDSLNALADILEQARVANLLSRSLTEELEAEETLKEIAGYVNKEALEFNERTGSRA